MEIWCRIRQSDAVLQKVGSADVASFDVSNDKCKEYLSLANIIFHIHETFNLYVFDLFILRKTEV